MSIDDDVDQMEADISILSEETVIAATQRLLNAIVERDWDTYTALVDPSITCFEPEAVGHLVQGLDFHKFYFFSDGTATNTSMRTNNTTLINPHVRLLGNASAVISYVRLTQDATTNETRRCEETRVWEGTTRIRNVHVHRSVN